MNTSESVQLSSKCFLYGKETRNNLESEVDTVIEGRDSALFLFRALGKILYCKSELFMLHQNFLPVGRCKGEYLKFIINMFHIMFYK